MKAQENVNNLYERSNDMKSEGEELIEELIEIIRQIKNMKSIKMLLGFAKALRDSE